MTAVNSGTGTIVDNDSAPQVSFSNATATEGSLIVFAATLTNPFTLEFNQVFSNGICIVTSGATNISVIFD